MSTTTADRAPGKTAGSRKSIYLVLGCTVFAAAAQVMMKFGAGYDIPRLEPADVSTWIPFVLAMLRDIPLIVGYALHACNALLLIMALRDGELSVLYPIISLTYVWVNILSVYFFGEHINFWKAFGIALVIGGVSLLGWASGQSTRRARTA